MTYERPPRPPQWAPDPVLTSTVAHAPAFLRMGWDQDGAIPFGPWRVSRPDPLSITNAPTDAALGAAPLLPENGLTEEVDAALDATRNASLNSPPSSAALQPAPGGDASPADLAALREQIRAEAHADAFAEGHAAGAAEREKQLQAEAARKAAQEKPLRDLVQDTLGALQGLGDEPQRFFEPLKRLALHIAEQLVRGELQVSGHVIQRLVQQSLAQLDQPTDKARVYLHPGDIARLQSLGEDAWRGLQLEADPQLHPGSVRVAVNDSLVEDLIEHRLETLAQKLLDDPQAWPSHSSLLRPGDSRAAPQWAERVIEAVVAPLPRDDAASLEADSLEVLSDTDTEAETREPMVFSVQPDPGPNSANAPDPA